MSISEKRTDPQRKSSHLWFEHIADTFNESGMDLQKVLVKRVPIRWSGHMVKEILFKGLAHTMYGVDSSAKLTKEQHTKVADTLVDLLAHEYQIKVDYPSRESLENERGERKWR